MTGDARSAAGPSATRLRARVQAVLDAADVPSPSADATAIVAEVLGCAPALLPLAAPPTRQQAADIGTLTARRAAREPLQHVLGHAGFRRLRLDIGPGVFVPRPETEVLVEEVLARLPHGARVVDLCSGSGAIAISIAVELPRSQVLAVEVDHGALEWLRRNRDLHSDAIGANGAELTILEASVLSSLPTDPTRRWAACDAVVANPPYIPRMSVPRDPEVWAFDPPAALFSGADGLDHVHAVVEIAAGLLREGGVLAIEHGDTQGDGPGDSDGVPGVLRTDPRFVEVTDVRDLADRPRVTLARRA